MSLKHAKLPRLFFFARYIFWFSCRHDGTKWTTWFTWSAEIDQNVTIAVQQITKCKRTAENTKPGIAQEGRSTECSGRLNSLRWRSSSFKRGRIPFPTAFWGVLTSCSEKGQENKHPHWHAAFGPSFACALTWAEGMPMGRQEPWGRKLSCRHQTLVDHRNVVAAVAKQVHRFVSHAQSSKSEYSEVSPSPCRMQRFSQEESLQPWVGPTSEFHKKKQTKNLPEGLIVPRKPCFLSTEMNPEIRCENFRGHKETFFFFVGRLHHFFPGL